MKYWHLISNFYHNLLISIISCCSFIYLPLHYSLISTIFCTFYFYFFCTLSHIHSFSLPLISLHLGGVPVILSLLDLHANYADLHRVAAVVLLRMLQESVHVGREIATQEGVRILLKSLEKGKNRIIKTKISSFTW